MHGVLRGGNFGLVGGADSFDADRNTTAAGMSETTPTHMGASPWSEPALGDPSAWFAGMVRECKDFAVEARAAGRPVVGILCEFAPRELLIAAGAIPVCLCGGDVDTIAAGETQLPASLCPLIKSTYGYMIEGSNPFLEMADLVVAETTCDGKTKMFELMAERRATFVLALPRRDDDPAALEAWTEELRRFRSFLADRYGVPIGAEDLRRAIGEMNRERRLRRRLAWLMRREDPPLTGRQLLDCRGLISTIPAHLERYEAVIERLEGVTEGVEGGRKGHGGRVRVLLTGVPTVHGAERVVDLIEDHGGLVVCQENCSGLKPILEDVAEDAADPIRALAEKYYHLPCSVRTPNRARLELIRQLAGEFRAQCVVDLVWHGCLTYAVESDRVRSMVEGGLGLPYLRLETDYSPADSARLVVRIEALLEASRSLSAEGRLL
jgi:benzoyl-CoA reductase/2-hydroxyglutaryl-CoA dehydratase subunit BcrC/BadD/HgdB